MRPVSENAIARFVTQAAAGNLNIEAAASFDWTDSPHLDGTRAQALLEAGLEAPNPHPHGSPDRAIWDLNRARFLESIVGTGRVPFEVEWTLHQAGQIAGIALPVISPHHDWVTQSLHHGCNLPEICRRRDLTPEEAESLWRMEPTHQAILARNTQAPSNVLAMAFKSTDELALTAVQHSGTKS